PALPEVRGHPRCPAVSARTVVAPARGGGGGDSARCGDSDPRHAKRSSPDAAGGIRTSALDGPRQPGAKGFALEGRCPMIAYRYTICDVFSDRPLAGNQLAVFPDAREIPESRLQPLAREINFSETVFAYPPAAGGHARIRIFT